ncbi:MAG: glycosyltransferase family 87 protein, partial [Planctomycetia bacterium]
PAVSAIGALAGIAIMGNSTVFALGHFSILCMGLVVAQMALLRNGCPVAAGICWALAMIKPQIALVFAPLFMIDRQWRGLVAGGGLLVALGLSACWWTGVPPLRAISGWWDGLGQSGTVSTLGQGVGPGSIAAALGIDPRHVHKALLAVLGGSLASMCWWLWRQPVDRGDRDRLIVPLAGVCAVLGEVCLYHFHYDNVMLAPSAIAMLAVAVARPAWWSWGLAALMMATLWPPHRYITMVPFNGIARAVIWVAVAAVLAKLVVAGSAARLPHRPNPQAPA